MNAFVSAMNFFNIRKVGAGGHCSRKSHTLSKPSKRRLPYRYEFEQLEDRLVPSSITDTLYFTTFQNQGGTSSSPTSNVGSVVFTYDSVAKSLILGTPQDVATTPGADGLVFTSDRQLAVGGQGNAVYKVNPLTGSFTTVTAGGSVAYHMMVSPNGTIYSGSDTLPGGLASFSKDLSANGTSHALTAC